MSGRRRRGRQGGAQPMEVEDNDKEKEEEEEEEEEEGEEGGDEEEDGDDEEDDEDDEDEDESDDEEPTPRVLPSRSTRGKRMNNLKTDGDDEFWAQEFFADPGMQDDEYSVSSVSDDVPDSDFDLTEDEEDEREVRVSRKPQKRLAAGAYREPGTVRKPAAKRAPRRSYGYVAGPPSRRKSSRSTTALKSDLLQEREKERREAPKVARVVRVVPKLTQKERIARALELEAKNRESLNRLVQLEEDRKKSVVRVREMTGPGVVYSSKGGRQLVSFVRPEELPPSLVDSMKQPAQPMLKGAVCVVSGKPAKYIDPLTKKPYHDAAAFKALRAQHAAASGGRRS